MIIFSSQWDHENIMFLGLLDLFAAFDTISQHLTYLSFIVVPWLCSKLVQVLLIGSFFRS